MVENTTAEDLGNQRASLFTSIVSGRLIILSHRIDIKRWTRPTKQLDYELEIYSSSRILTKLLSIVVFNYSSSHQGNWLFQIKYLCLQEGKTIEMCFQSDSWYIGSNYSGTSSYDDILVIANVICHFVLWPIVISRLHFKVHVFVICFSYKSWCEDTTTA